MSFDIPIRIDDAAARAAAARVTGELDRMERAGKAAEAMIKRAVQEGTVHWTSAAEATRRLTGELAATERAADKARVQAANLASQLSAASAARGFQGLSQHFERVADVVERVHGPMREHLADVSALSTAYRNGLISAKEYTNEMVRMRSAQQGGVGSGIIQGAGLGVLQGGAAGIAAAATGKVLELGHDLLELGDAYTGLGNRINSVSKSQTEQGYLMDRTRQIANAARAEWDATGELFVRLTNATKDMNLSQSHTLRLTETISKAFAQSGATGAEASGAMLQLSQAFAMGSLHGQEFNSVNAAAPFLLDIFAQKLGVTRSALKHMAEEGKITSQVMIAAFDDAGASVDASFAKSVPTFSQSMTVFKNQMEGVFGPLLQTLLPKLGEYLAGIGDRITGIVNLIEKAANELNKIPGGSTAKDAAGKLYEYGPSMLDPTAQVRKMADHYDQNAAELLHAQVDPAVWQSYADRFSTLNEQIADTVKAFTSAQAPVETFDQQMEKLRDTTRDLPAHVERSERAWDNTFKVLDGGLGILGQIGPKFDEILLSWSGVDQLILPGLDTWLGKVTDLTSAHTALADGSVTAIGRYSVMLGNFITKFAEDTKALKAWDDTLNKSTGTHKKHADSWASTFVSPTLVQIDLLITKLKEFLAWKNEAERAPGLRDLGVPQKGLAGGLPSGAATSATIQVQNVDDAKYTRDQNAERERLARLPSLAQNRAMADYRKQLEQTQEMWDKIGQAIQGASDKFVDFMFDGKQSFAAFTEAVLKDLSKIIIKELLAAAIKAAIGGGGVPSFFHTGATQGFEGQYGTEAGYNPAAWVPVPHAANGWSGTVGGGSSYSGDRVPFFAMVNSGERVTIAPEQSGGSSAKRPLTIYLNDRDDAEFEDMTIRVIRRNPSVISSITGR